jgi:preprotein translocase subunit YajC
MTIAYANTNDNVSTSTTAVSGSSGGVAEGSFESIMINLAPIFLIFIVFYFLVLRPHDKKRKEQEKLVDSVKKGEEVLLSSGLYGIVSKVPDGDNIEIEISNKVIVKCLKSSIVDVIGRKANEQK